MKELKNVWAGPVPAHKQNGITLVALIITIIIMLILVGVSVQVVINSDLIGTAQDAANRTEAKYQEESNISEIELGDKTYNSIDEYVQSLGEHTHNYEGGICSGCGKTITVDITLSAPSNDFPSPGEIVTYTITISTEGTIVTSDIQAKVIDSTGVEVADVPITITGNGVSYTVSVEVNTIWDHVAPFRLKIPEGVVVTNEGAVSTEQISERFLYQHKWWRI